MLKFERTDDGFCRVYYREGRKLRCFQEETRDQFTLYACSGDGEPSHETRPAVMAVDRLPNDDSSTARAFCAWWQKQAHARPGETAFHKGQRVTVLVETKGDDHESHAHTIAPGSPGIIESIHVLAAPQGVAYEVWIPVPGSPDRGIVNIFDESDGPIDNFLVPIAGAGEVAGS